MPAPVDRQHPRASLEGGGADVVAVDREGDPGRPRRDLPGAAAGTRQKQQDRCADKDCAFHGITYMPPPSSMARPMPTSNFSHQMTTLS